MNVEVSGKKVKRKSVFREYAEAAVIAILLALFIRTFVVQAFKIPSGSMEPTLLVGDHILVNKFVYGVKIPFINRTVIPIGKPKRGDVIVFIYPVDRSKDFIKRVIGLPGDRVEIIDKTIFINGEPYKDDHGYYSESGGKLTGASIKRPPFGPKTVPDNNLLVLGDNRDHSSDSRVWGFVPLSSVKGKAFIIYWSWPNWKRFLHLIR